MNNLDHPRDTVPTEVPGSPDPFDPASLAIAPGAGADGGVGVKKALIHVPVRKPLKSEFVRVNPAPEYRMLVAIIEDKDARETYLVVPVVAAVLPGDTTIRELRVAMTRQGTAFLWPVPVPSEDGRDNAWNLSQREAADRAEKHWVRVVSNMALGAYDVFEAQGDLPDPVWPEHPFQKLLSIAFGNGKLVDREDHPLVQRLMGRM
ncbi:MAG: hypothetical protein O7C66_08975 [Alphaproteobacteria bacterium]|nr:hypothetical protein [Alphaproteobacteria bacterium]